MEQQNQSLSNFGEKLKNKSGESYWRSLEELSETKEFQETVKHEFPQESEFWNRSTTRRSFLKLMGSMLAMAGLAGCTRQPTEKIVPYSKQPEELVPGKPLYFATAIPMNGFARGLLVENHMGRPTKVEGNPEHPDSLGAADSIAQASVLSLYDPDRSKNVSHNGSDSTWQSFLVDLKPRVDFLKEKQGEGLRIVTKTVASPTLASQIKRILKIYPKAKWIQYSPVNRDNARQGAIYAYGEDVSMRYDFKKADVVLTLDSDCLNQGAGSLRYLREFSSRRKLDNKNVRMNRLYSVESTPTLTGSMADHRLGVKASEVETFIVLLAQSFGFRVGKPGVHFSNEKIKWINAVAKDLAKNKGKSLIVVGENQTPTVHAIAHVLNQALQNIGKTLTYQDTIELESSAQMSDVRSLTLDLNSQKVSDLFLIDTNLAYNTPGDLNLKEAIKKAGFKVHLGMYQDETAKDATWHIPQSHYMESWSDARSFDGTASIVQPLIHPLYSTKSSHELLEVLASGSEKDSYDIVKSFWQKEKDPLTFNTSWEKYLHDGVIKNTKFITKKVSLKKDLNLPSQSQKTDSDLEIIFQEDLRVGDGEYANNGWLQELPKPLTRIAWDNVALVGPSTAKKLDVSNEDVVELSVDGKSVEAPIWILPGHAKESITVQLGYGRTSSGKISDGIGFNAYKIQHSKSPNFSQGLKVKKLNKKYKIACVQDHHSMENRHLVRSTDLKDYKKHPDFAQHMTHEPKPTDTLYKPEEHLKGDHQWGMTIDLNACIGCGACTVACQSENNIPVVGKDEVSNGREMSWIRVDRYYKGDLDNPETAHQPVPCMHCENAPCEPVCPVGATTHSDEGLNEMTYNRCVGTRYCSNNCSYKVRRFNFFQYVDNDIPSLKLQRNPDVTVRSRGVMEKCTYCVQRINVARIDAKKEDRKIKDGEVVTACQQTCPAQAITFGDISDKASDISKEKDNPRNYGILTDLGTRPRTSYLAKVKNLNPELAESKHDDHGDHH